MKTRRLTQVENGAEIATDLAIVGAGPVGLVIAERCARAGMDVLLLESGCEEQDPAHEALNRVLAGSHESAAARTAFHKPQAHLWDAHHQAYGVRCRGLGGSTQAWAGKSAAFDAIDFERREWVGNSGWPFGPEELLPHLGEALTLLGLSPQDPETEFAAAGLQSFYWQFARSQVDRLDIMRFGRDFARGIGDRVTCILDATVTSIRFDESSEEVTGLEIASLSGARISVRPKRVVLAGGAIENARLLLSSPCGRPGASCNRHDVVGRYLIDHASTRLGGLGPDDAPMLARKFGFRSHTYGGRSHMFQHGLAMEPDFQREQCVLNGAVWFAQERAPDNPWTALERLLRRRSKSVGSDLATTIRGSGLILRGTAARSLASPRMPDLVRRVAVEAAMRVSPNTVAVEFQTGGLPHKLSGISLEAIIETEPRRENRIGLSVKRDALGQPIATAIWKTGEAEERTLRVLGKAVERAFGKSGLPPPNFERWLASTDEGPSVIDCAHSMGTTRMAIRPTHGAVDVDCRVYGSRNLYMAGGSVFPTGGHANPTCMFLAMALRLADHLATRQARPATGSRPDLPERRHVLAS